MRYNLRFENHASLFIAVSMAQWVYTICLCENWETSRRQRATCAIRRSHSSTMTESSVWKGQLFSYSVRSPLACDRKGTIPFGSGISVASS
ncbi:Uncharacterized protein HZ326_31146 [Fusarium oxysporum f. sp. albedinis]|nr:Uncharacterized protein HZ326_31146 [Fusarium oxysporum f. sp. albedinis]